MMRGYIVFCFALGSCLASVAALPSRVERKKADDTPPRCCLPNKYSTVMTQLSSVHTDVFTVYQMQMDYERKQQVMKIFTVPVSSPNSTDVKVLNDYNKNMTYVVTGDQCKKFALVVPLYGCVPDDAQYLGSGYMGPPRGGQLFYDAWRMKAPNFQFTISIARDGCVPLLEAVTHPDKPSENQLFAFNDFQPYLTDQSAFVLPPSCQ